MWKLIMRYPQPLQDVALLRLYILCLLVYSHYFDP
jgi:hypothetical protein